MGSGGVIWASGELIVHPAILSTSARQVTFAVQLIFSTNKLDRLIDADRRTAAEIANLAGIRPSYLSQLRKGARSNPRLAVMKKLAEVLEVPIQKFTASSDVSEFTETPLRSSTAIIALDQTPEEELFLEGTEAMGRKWTINKLAEWFGKGKKDEQFLQARLHLIALAVEKLQETEPETET